MRSRPVRSLALLGIVVVATATTAPWPSGRLEAPIAAPPGWQAERADAPKLFATGQRSIALDAQGEPHVAYGGDRLYYAVHDGAGWHLDVADATDAVGGGASIALDPAGKAHISYVDGVNARLLHATNASGAWAIETIASGVHVGGTSIARDAGGKLHVAYYDTDSQDLDYATNASGAWVVTPIDTAGVVGVDCSLALDSSGHVHISYSTGSGLLTLSTPGSLRYATNESGRWRTETADGRATKGGSVGGATSIAVDSKGVAHIAYEDSRESRLGSVYDLAYATNAGGRWTLSTLTTGDLVQASISIAVDAADHVHIGYERLDANNGFNPVLRYATDASGAFATEDVEAGGAGVAIAERGGVVHLVHERGDGTMRRAFGSSHAWTGEDVDRTTYAGSMSSLKLDSAGKAYVGYLANAGASFATNASVVWVTQVLDASNQNYENGASLGLDSGLHAHVVSYHYDPGPGGFGVVTSLRDYTNLGGSFATEVVDSGGTASEPAASLAMDGSGQPHVAYSMNFAPSDHALIRYAVRSGSGWTTETIEDADAASLHLVDGVGLTLDGAGKAHVAYSLFDFGDVVVKYATNASGAWVITPVVTGLDFVGPVAIALDAGGHVKIVYDSSGSIYYGTNETGAWTNEFVATGSNPQIVLDSSGDAHVSFHAGVALAYATNASGSWRVVTIDRGAGGSREFSAATFTTDENAGSAVVSVTPSGAGGAGSTSSIALDALGRPHFAYTDDGLGDLKYARPDTGLAPPVITVDYVVTPDTAQSPADFTSVQGTLGWGAGDTATKGFVVPVRDNGQVTGNLTANLALRDPSGGSILGAQSTATLVIRDADLPPGTIVSHFLPRSVKLSVNAKTKSKSKLILSGYIDTGLPPVDLTAPATLTVGGLTYAIPALVKKSNSLFRYTRGALDFQIQPQKSGSSRAKFRLAVTGDFTGKVNPDGPLTLRFADGLIDATGTVGLQKGVYAITRIRGTLTAPIVYPVAVKGVVAGGGKDSLTLTAGLGSLGATPTTAPDVTVSFGAKFSVTVTSAQFSAAKHEKFTASDKAHGVTSLSLDYGREVLVLSAKNVDLGTIAAGAAPVLITVATGATSRTVLVRVAHKGKSLTY